MSSPRRKWIDVDLDGLRKLLERRGKEFAIYELVQNAWDEDVNDVHIELTRPERGRSQLIARDDSPNGFRDLEDAYTMYAESYKKTDPEKRGAFNLGEKLVLALCDEATISSTTGQVIFDKSGRRRTKARRERGTEFCCSLRLTLAEYERIAEKVCYLIPPVATWFNNVEIPSRKPLAKFIATLPTVVADKEGSLRQTKRAASIEVYEPIDSETAMLYEMGIPVVETGDTWHVNIEQKVPLNMERDNVTPAFLRAVRVAVVNGFGSQLDKRTATEPWVREAAGDPRIAPYAFRHIIASRFGEQTVSFDPSDISSNREAASQAYTVVTGGSLSADEWANVRRTGAIQPAGQLFPTNRSTKEPDKRYSQDEWTAEMSAYAAFVEMVSPELVGRRVSIEYIRDPRMVCGQFFGSWFNVNLAKHNVTNWQTNIELMLHELAHTVVQSNDHLHHDFHETIGRLGAKLAIIAATCTMPFIPPAATM
jgi:hypothetical protein